MHSAMTRTTQEVASSLNGELITDHDRLINRVDWLIDRVDWLIVALLLIP